MPDQSDLLLEIEKFLLRHDMSASAFGKEAVNDRGFVRQLRRGRQLLPNTMRKVREFMVKDLI
ncbi:MAG TPA: hypothetical protein VKA19_14110 [Alphaproteobacteria bacterium]|nr:hypothetical protein [Alphaproteobacteria bacterium]